MDSPGRHTIAPVDPAVDLVLRLAYYTITEDFEVGRSNSTMLVFFSAVRGHSGPYGEEYLRPHRYTPILSRLIYCVRLIFIEATLPQFEHSYVNIACRPQHGQLETLNAARRDRICDGTMSPMGEFFSLLDYGRALRRSEGPVYHFYWSEDGQTLSWDGQNYLTITHFRSLAHEALRQASAHCKRLMYDWDPSDVDLANVWDRLPNTTNGYSFVSDPVNGLEDAYLELFMRACVSPIDASRLRGICNYGARLCAVTRSHKARLTTNNEFQVARFFSPVVSKLVYRFLVYIRPTAVATLRKCFHYNPSAVLLFTPLHRQATWTTKAFTDEIHRLSKSVPGIAFQMGARLYRQISITTTKRHVSRATAPFNRFNDISSSSYIGQDITFAWQSGHRPLQRQTTYGLNGTFPDQLQPALLNIYAGFSAKWHAFWWIDEHLDSGITMTNTHGHGNGSSNNDNGAENTEPLSGRKRPDDEMNHMTFLEQFLRQTEPPERAIMSEDIVDVAVDEEIDEEEEEEEEKDVTDEDGGRSHEDDDII
ncbi:hypothetical protein FOZG_17402 [Fusarium oxysporum Fo47]|uniref:Uncharacterized protein n=1 Tax=Fusarium oxysporum Fo47 TaxID=660027 RepID=W9JES7_FUSOX|nr:hypothetical protein FOZG_17402 [Fusarium oxysporum Fo47]